MTRFSLVLAASTALTSVAHAADTAKDYGVTPDTAAPLSEAAEAAEASAESAYDTVTAQAKEAADATSAAANDAMESAKEAYRSSVETVQETVETLAARAEMGEARAVAPIDLDNRTEFRRASAMIGADIYTLTAEAERSSWMTGSDFEGISTEWQQVGSVAELVIGADGAVHGIIAEVGGFLGLGDTHVMVEMAEIRWTKPDDDGDYAFVTRFSEEELADLPPVEAAWWQ